METQPTPKPSLHEIAAMPFSETMKAIRQFYDPKFGIGGDAEQGAIEFTVSIDWSYRRDECDQITVRADSLAEAREKAKDIWQDDIACGEDPEIDHIDIREVKPQ